MSLLTRAKGYFVVICLLMCGFLFTLSWKLLSYGAYDSQNIDKPEQDSKTEIVRFHRHQPGKKTDSWLGKLQGTMVTSRLQEDQDDIASLLAKIKELGMSADEVQQKLVHWQQQRQGMSHNASSVYPKLHGNSVKPSTTDQVKVAVNDSKSTNVKSLSSNKSSIHPSRHKGSSKSDRITVSPDAKFSKSSNQDLPRERKPQPSPHLRVNTSKKSHARTNITGDIVLGNAGATLIDKNKTRTFHGNKLRKEQASKEVNKNLDYNTQSLKANVPKMKPKNDQSEEEHLKFKQLNMDWNRTKRKESHMTATVLEERHPLDERQKLNDNFKAQKSKNDIFKASSTYFENRTKQKLSKKHSRSSKVSNQLMDTNVKTSSKPRVQKDTRKDISDRAINSLDYDPIIEEASLRETNLESLTESRDGNPKASKFSDRRVQRMKPLNEVFEQLRQKYPIFSNDLPQDDKLPEVPGTQRPDYCKACFDFNFPVIIDHGQMCKSESGRSISVQLLMFISSAPENYHARTTIRETWGAKCQDSTLKCLFVIGLSDDKKVNTKLVLENEHHKDILQFGFKDSYSNLTYKTISSLNWAKDNCYNAKYVMKTDDDMYINTDLIPIMLQAAPSRKFMGGYCWGSSDPNRDVNSKWFVSFKSFHKPKFPPMCSGTGYIMSMDVLRSILFSSKNVPFFHLEDVYISLCLQKYGLLPVNIMGFSNMFQEFDACRYKNQVMTSHQVPPELLEEFWETMNQCPRANISPSQLYIVIPFPDL